jgi:hypothetical protein
MNAAGIVTLRLILMKCLLTITLTISTSSDLPPACIVSFVLYRNKTVYDAQNIS